MVIGFGFAGAAAFILQVTPDRRPEMKLIFPRPSRLNDATAFQGANPAFSQTQNAGQFSGRYQDVAVITGTGLRAHFLEALVCSPLPGPGIHFLQQFGNLLERHLGKLLQLSCCPTQCTEPCEPYIERRVNAISWPQPFQSHQSSVFA